MAEMNIGMFVSEMSHKEHLARQKQLLNKTLGLEGGFALASVGGEELFKEEDLIIESTSVQDSVMAVFVICHIVLLIRGLHGYKSHEAIPAVWL